MPLIHCSAEGCLNNKVLMNIWYCNSHQHLRVVEPEKLKPGEHPTTTLVCKYPGCYNYHDFDVADQIPAKWRCSAHSRLKCQHEGCDETKRVDSSVDIDTTYWWCSDHANEVQKNIREFAKQPTFKVEVEEIVSLEDLQRKAFHDIAVMMAFNQFSETGMREILGKLSRFSHVLGKADGPDA